MNHHKKQSHNDDDLLITTTAIADPSSPAELPSRSSLQLAGRHHSVPWWRLWLVYVRYPMTLSNEIVKLFAACYTARQPIQFDSAR